MRNFSIISLAFVALAGCGSDKTAETSDATKTTAIDVGSTTETPVPEPEVPPPAPVTADTAVYIDCQYADRSTVSYRIKEDMISAFSDTESRYIDNIAYLLDWSNNRNFSWYGEGQKNRYFGLRFNSSPESFTVNILQSISDGSTAMRMQSSINRKTGKITNTIYNLGGSPTETRLVGDCYPGEDKTAQENQF